jgi:hypothetical protein
MTSAKRRRVLRIAKEKKAKKVWRYLKNRARLQGFAYRSKANEVNDELLQGSLKIYSR